VVSVCVRISSAEVNDSLRKWQKGEHDAKVNFGTLTDAGTDYRRHRIRGMGTARLLPVPP
jgi:hypothetical protein